MNGPNRDRSREVNEGAGAWMGTEYHIRPYRCHFCEADARYGKGGHWFCLAHWLEIQDPDHWISRMPS